MTGDTHSYVSATRDVNARGVHRTRLLTIALAIQILLSPFGFVRAAGTELPELKRPLSKVEALNLALARNGTIRQARKEVEAAAGIAIQTRAILFPTLINGATYSVLQDSLIEANRNRTGKSSRVNNQSWDADIRIVQSIYEGGRMLSAARSAPLIREQALLVFQSTVADTLLSVANAYDDALRRAKQVEVREQQVKFLTEYRDDTKARFDAGTVPEFDVIRQEVEVANGTAQLVEAQGDYRVAKQKLVELLGYDLPTQVTDNLPLSLTTPLVAPILSARSFCGPVPGTSEPDGNRGPGEGRTLARRSNHYGQGGIETKRAGFRRIRAHQPCGHAQRRRLRQRGSCRRANVLADL
jgi:outer membrane protein TolC